MFFEWRHFFDPTDGYCRLTLFILMIENIHKFLKNYDNLAHDYVNVKMLALSALQRWLRNFRIRPSQKVTVLYSFRFFRMIWDQKSYEKPIISVPHVY